MTWLLADGQKINFWTNAWLDRSIVDILSIPSSLHACLKARVCDFIHDGARVIPPTLATRSPQLSSNIMRMPIPLLAGQDKIVWQGTDSGDLTFKDAYYSMSPSGQSVSWGNTVWSQFIPPSKSFLLWRLLYDKMPMNENLKKRGCILVSMCCLCSVAAESSHHLFLDCTFALSLWSWLSALVNHQIGLTSFASVLAICNLRWSSQLKDFVLDGIVFVIGAIWKCRNNLI